MRTCLSILFMFALSGPTLTSAQDKASNDLNTLLRDASYIFNRFEEVSGGIASHIDTKVPVEIRQTTKGTLSSVLILVSMEKPALNALFDRSNVSSADVFDVYTTLAAVASELEDASGWFDRWGDQRVAMDLAQLSAKAGDLGVKLAVALRSQIAAQELQLTLCTQKTPSHK